MSAIYEDNKKYYIYTKGSLENLINRCKYVLLGGKKEKLTKEIKNKYLDIEKEYSHEALKVLSFAYKEVKNKYNNEEDYFKEENDLILVGLVALKDPARKNVKEAIQTCRDAGIRPIMLTGDNLETALAIGKEVGIISSDDEGINASVLNNLKKSELMEAINKYSVFARVSPDNKLQIVKSLQRRKKL